MNPKNNNNPKINVTVKLYGALRRYRPENLAGNERQPFPFSLAEGSKVAELLENLNIAEGFISAIAVNGQSSDAGAGLRDGDDIRLFPPSAGGQNMQIYIAGVMQGSREDQLVNTQDYRTLIADALEKHYPAVSVIDPFALYPESTGYDIEQARQTFEAEIALAAEADLMIAYLPEASMGTAIEMWVAHRAGKKIIAVTQLAHNWVVRLTADEILPDLRSLLAAIEQGRLKILENRTSI